MRQTLTFLIFLAAALGSGLQAQTLVAYYPFDGNANDVTDFGNNATVSGATLTAGYNGTPNSAYLFNGVADSIVAPNATQLATNTATYALWVRADKLVASGESYILYHGGWKNRVKISLPDHGRPVFTTNSDGKDSTIIDMDAKTESLTVGEWTHIAMTHTPGRNTIYINGDSAHTVRAPGNLSPTSRPLVFGSDADGTGGQRFTGAIDDVRIYGEALTTAQVRALYQTLTSLKDVNFTKVGKLYPNPATTSITFENSISDQAARYELNDMLGRTIGRGYVNSAREEIDLAGVPAGAYVLRVFGTEVQSSSKFFVE